MNQVSLLSEQPPFDSFWFSSRFNLPSTTPTEIQDLAFYSVMAESEGLPGSDQFRYESPNTSEEITVSANGDIISLSSKGILNLIGTTAPLSFTRDVTLWSPTCGFEIVCQINKNTKVVTRATLHLFSETFNSSYDLTSIMFFEEGEKISSGNAPEWSIGNEVSLVENVSRAHSLGMTYLFVVDDVLGTSYKN